jgi:hypothetical protein
MYVVLFVGNSQNGRILLKEHLTEASGQNYQRASKIESKVYIPAV